MCVLLFGNKNKKESQSEDGVSSGLCRRCRGTCLSVPGCFEACEHAGICSYRREKSAVQSLQEKGGEPAWKQAGMGCDGGNSGKGACSWPDKAERQQRRPECAPRRPDMQS